jgi:hypothetical protein
MSGRFTMPGAWALGADGVVTSLTLRLLIIRWFVTAWPALVFHVQYYGLAMAPPRAVNRETILRPKSSVFRLLVDETGLTDALHEFVTHPRASRNELPVIQDLHEIAPGMVPVLESMVLDGVEKRQDVADYVHAVLFGLGTIQED